jgi:hypothetical protein
VSTPRNAAIRLPSSSNRRGTASTRAPRHPYRARVAKASSTLNQPVVRMLSRLPERANSPKNADGRDRDARQLQQNTNKTEDDGPRVHRSDDTRPPGPPVAQLAGEPGSRATARSQGHESRMDER